MGLHYCGKKKNWYWLELHHLAFFVHPCFSLSLCHMTGFGEICFSLCPIPLSGTQEV